MVVNILFTFSLFIKGIPLLFSGPESFGFILSLEDDIMDFGDVFLFL